MTEENKLDNVIYIGKKPTIGYVLAVLTQLSQNVPEVIIRARGKQISRAVTVLELLKRKYRPDIKVKSITTSSEELQSKDGKTVRVSAIEIVVSTK
jgi:DNA-binding protein